jgi:hypothetical protein
MRDDTPDGYQVTIRTCEGIGQLVVVVEYVHPALSGIIQLASPSEPNRALHLIHLYTSDIRDIDSLAAELWRRHGGVISEGKFSYHNGAWRQFDQTELERIRQSLTPGEGEETYYPEH